MIKSGYEVFKEMLMENPTLFLPTKLGRLLRSALQTQRSCPVFCPDSSFKYNSIRVERNIQKQKFWLSEVAIVLEKWKYEKKRNYKTKTTIYKLEVRSHISEDTFRKILIFLFGWSILYSTTTLQAWLPLLAPGKHLLLNKLVDYSKRTAVLLPHVARFFHQLQRDQLPVNLCH